MAAIQQQQQLQRQLLAQQMLMQQQAAAAAAAATASAVAAAASGSTAVQTADRKAREIYVGNLAIGVVTPDMLKELFNAILGSHVPDPVNQPPVCNVTMDPNAGRFAFVEFRTRELCDAAAQLDKLELCGRQMNIGRPKGYVDPKANLMSAATVGHAQISLAAALGQVPAFNPASMAQLPPPPALAPPTTVVLLENMVNCGTIRDDQERTEIVDDVHAEVVKCGPVLGLAAPLPPPSVLDADASRVYVHFAAADGAQKCKAIMDGRRFDENIVKATFVSEADFARAKAGEWIVGLPAAPPMGAAAGGIPGFPGMLPAGLGAPAMPGLPPGFALPPGFSLPGVMAPK